MTEGDAANLEKGLPWSELGEFTLCLNSPGGLLNEGIEMAAILSNKGVATMVTRDSFCASACAVAFLGGRCEVQGDAGIYSNRCRFIEKGAVLGFHAPFLQELEEAQARVFSSEEVRGFWSTSRTVAGVYAKVLVEYGVPLDIALDFLAVDARSLSVVETIGQARAMDIIVIDHNWEKLEHEAIIETCANAQRSGDWKVKLLKAPDGDFRLDFLKEGSGFVAIASQVSFLNYPYATWKACRVHYEKSGGAVYPTYASREGKIRVEMCNRIMLEIPETLKIPFPQYRLNNAGEIETVGQLFHEDECKPVDEHLGAKVGMWFSGGDTKIATAQ